MTAKKFNFFFFGIGVGFYSSRVLCSAVKQIGNISTSCSYYFCFKKVCIFGIVILLMFRCKFIVGWALFVKNLPLEIRRKGYGPWNLDLGLYTLDLELWTLDFGPWTLDFRHWTLDLGLWTLDFGPWTLDLGPDFLHGT